MSSNFSNVQEDLLVKYLLGEATDAERDEVTGWIAASEENKKYYEHFSLIWNESKKIEASSNVDVDAAWNKFKERRKKSETKILEFAPKKFNWARAAAVLALVAGAGWMAYMMGTNDSNQMMAVNSGNAVIVDTLPDGSIVTLNKNSSINYNSKLDGDIRSVKLKGEAFFNVAPDKKHPFVIDANGTKITVVGTAFNVKTTETLTEVVVESGIVDVAKNRKEVRLIADQKATVLDEPTMSRSEDELYNYYKTNTFVCHDVSLSRFVAVLNEVYGANIEIGNDNYEHIPLNTTFRKRSLEEVLNEVVNVISAERHITVQLVSKGTGQYSLQ